MRFSGSESVGNRGEDKKLGSSRSRKKHKRLDAICEEAYTRSHIGAEKVELVEAKEEPHDMELRRSSRVRRAPVVLDASPTPAKKRRIDKKSGVSSVDRGKKVVGTVKSETPCSTSQSLDEDSGWRLRLRSRDRCVNFEGRENGSLPTKGRRKLFKGSDEGKEEPASSIEAIVDNEDEFICGNSNSAKSKRVKALIVLDNEDQENKSSDDLEDDKQINEEKMLGSGDEENSMLPKIEDVRVNDGLKDDLIQSKTVQEMFKVQTGSPSKKLYSEDNAEPMELDFHLGNGSRSAGEHQTNDAKVEGATAVICQAKDADHNEKCFEDGIFEKFDTTVHSLDVVVDVAVAITEQSKDVRHNEKHFEDGIHEKLDTATPSSDAGVDGAVTGADQTKDIGHNEKHFKDGISEKLYKPVHSSDVTLGPLRIKEGRRCGLCGGGNDGKPPGKLVQDGTVSDSVACSGGSASEEHKYDIWDGFGDEPGWLGRLLGPINDRYGIAGIWVHQQCAVWSPEVYFAGLGCLKNVRAALCRGRALKCIRCGRPGATIGCRVDRCPKTYHLPCARASGSIFDHRKFLITCRVHRHLFQPHGSQYLNRMKKMKFRKLKLDKRKMSIDALRNDIEAEEKWLENCGEDEEFMKRESKRLHRDLLRTAPVYIGGANSNDGIQFEGWESVAGLQDVIDCMKEVVILPLLYPDFFNNIGLTPPRGVLLHGYPGTGKTLVVRALIGSCARGDRKIAYFARKGADCLGKYVGDAERQLRLLFQVAEKSQPSIIFFDEIDGLAPCRGRQQDQTHSSVVSTLLSLLDGLKSRGSVVVIGATNRPDAVDPALRRPGRFDREIYFPLPSIKDREAILSLHTQKWPKPISGSLLKWVARRTVGFAGADLQALCTQAAIIALRRSFPLQEVLSGAGETSLSKRLPLPTFVVKEGDWFDALSSAPPPCSHREAGSAARDVVSAPLAAHLFPCLLQPLSRLLVSLYLDEHVWLPPSLIEATTSIKNVIISALDKKKVQSDKWWCNLRDLLQEADTLNEIKDNLSGTLLIENSYGCFDTFETSADDGHLKFKHSIVQRVGAHPGLLHSFLDESGKKPGFRILICGKPRSGQRHMASCFLHCFVGNVEIRKLDLATMYQDGHGDVIQGLTYILMRCACLHPCMIFLPRIDLWAVDTCYQSADGQSDSPSSNRGEVGELGAVLNTQSAVRKESYLWKSFVEQVESISGCSSMMFLATSEVPFLDLPSGIKQFFSSEVLNPSQPHLPKDPVPLISVQIDGDLDRGGLIETSATRLSKDLVQYFINLTRVAEHSHESSLNQIKVCDSVKGDLDMIPHGSDPGSTTKPGSKCPFTPIFSVTLRSPGKGKPSLLEALSTFGYQILLFPQFAELCWVTSKLKEGPCTHIKGPWKGWPFNSCIVRHVNSIERVSVTCNSNAAKNKEKSFVVRGLIAIGLTAYRGEYTSIREVFLEVRKVLELLVGRVNDKIQAGKDKYKFFHLLCQVGSFEDMVSSWIHTLRSLDGDAQFYEGSQRLNCTESLKNLTTTKDRLCDGDDCKKNSSEETLHELGLLKENPQGTNDLMDVNNLNSSKRSVGVAAVLQESSDHGALERSACNVHLPSPLANGITPRACMQMDVMNPTEVGSDLGCTKMSDGRVQRDSGALLEDGSRCLDDKYSVESSDSWKVLNQGDSSLPPMNNHPVENHQEKSSGHISSTVAVLPPNDSGRVCMYRCCSQCLAHLHQLLLKILNHEWEMKGSDIRVDDFHDMVASLSASLLSALRKSLASKSSSHVYVECKECKSSGNVFMPMECCCHSTGKGTTMIADLHIPQNLKHGFDLRFLFRDGVLVPWDADQGSHFHCKFDTLCLCLLVNCIGICKEP